MIADRLQKDRDAVARATVALMRKRSPDIFRRYASVGEEKCVQDTCYHLDYLASAVAIDAQEVFDDYLDWLVDLLVARGIPAGDISANLDALSEVLADRYGEDASLAVAMLQNRRL